MPRILEKNPLPLCYLDVEQIWWSTQMAKTDNSTEFRSDLMAAVRIKTIQDEFNKRYECKLTQFFAFSWSFKIYIYYLYS